MNIRFLETAVQLARNHSFRLTAEVLNITQAAVSSRVAAMEQELGVRLFDRQSRDLAMTKEGEEFIRGARAIIEQYETLVTSLRPAPQIKGLVRLGLVPSMAQILLPDIVRTLRENYPAVSFELTTDSHGTLAQLLEDNKLDVCLTLMPETVSERQEVCPLLTLGMFWIASPTLIPYSTDRLGMSDLARFPIISYAAGSLNSKRMASYLGDDFSADHIVHASNSLATSIHMTVNGIGIMVAPAVVIQRELREGLLQVLNVERAFTSTDYAIIYFSGARHPQCHPDRLYRTGGGAKALPAFRSFARSASFAQPARAKAERLLRSMKPIGGRLMPGQPGGMPQVC